MVDFNVVFSPYMFLSQSWENGHRTIAKGSATDSAGLNFTSIDIRFTSELPNSRVYIYNTLVAKYTSQPHKIKITYQEWRIYVGGCVGQVIIIQSKKVLIQRQKASSM